MGWSVFQAAGQLSGSRGCPGGTSPFLPPRGVGGGQLPAPSPREQGRGDVVRAPFQRQLPNSAQGPVAFTKGTPQQAGHFPSASFPLIPVSGAGGEEQLPPPSPREEGWGGGCGAAGPSFFRPAGPACSRAHLRGLWWQPSCQSASAGCPPPRSPSRRAGGGAALPPPSPREEGSGGGCHRPGCCSLWRSVRHASVPRAEALLQAGLPSPLIPLPHAGGGGAVCILLDEDLAATERGEVLATRAPVGRRGRRPGRSGADRAAEALEGRKPADQTPEAHQKRWLPD